MLSIRLEENYLAIVTIGFGEVVRILLLNESWLTGGAIGIADIPRPFVSLVSSARYDIVLLCFSLALVAVMFVLLEILVRSPFGRVLRAVRDDATVAAALGKPVLVLRVKAFAIGGAVMGLAGALHAFYLTYIDPSQFTSIITAYAFMAVIAGGRGSNVGLLFGAGTIMALLEATRFLKDAIQVIDGTQLAALRLGSDRRRYRPAADPAAAGIAAGAAATRPRFLSRRRRTLTDAARNPPAIHGAAAAHCRGL